MGDEAEYGLVMPFVAVASKGGPYKDDAFVAGYRCGEIDARLQGSLGVGGGPRELSCPVEPALVPQLDLLAMRHGYTLSVEPWAEDPEAWSTATFTKNPP